MGERRGRGREWGGKEKGRKIGMHEKIAHKHNKFGPVSCSFRKLFSGTLPSQILRLHLEPFKSNRASKLTILENSTYLAFWGATWGYPHTF